MRLRTFLNWHLTGGDVRSASAPRQWAPDDTRVFLYAVLSVIGVLDILWIGLPAVALGFTGKIRWSTAICSAIAVWFTVIVRQVAMVTYGASAMAGIS